MYGSWSLSQQWRNMAWKETSWISKAILIMWIESSTRYEGHDTYLNNLKVIALARKQCNVAKLFWGSRPQIHISCQLRERHHYETTFLAVQDILAGMQLGVLQRVGLRWCWKPSPVTIEFQPLSGLYVKHRAIKEPKFNNYSETYDFSLLYRLKCRQTPTR